MSDPIRVVRDGPILEVTMDRPKANAIDAATSRIMSEVFVDFRDDPDLRVAIITAAGEKFFSAGWDLKAVSAGEAPDADYGAGGFGGLQELPNLNKPVIAAVNGMAVGGGLEIMISADIILAAAHARFALPEIKVGVIADAAAIKLRRRIPYHVAVEFLMTGRWMEVAEAKHWGLVNEVLPADQVLPRARAIAAALAEGPPLIHAAIKDVLRRTENVDELPAFDLLAALATVRRVYDSQDLVEGATAFADKRKPDWKGQ